MPNVKKKILIVEDEAFLLDLYQAKLVKEGFEVVTCINGEEGIACVIDHSPDLILLDILMPKVDGFGLLEEIKKLPGTKKIPVIIFSNLSQKEQIDKGLKLGAASYIVKTSVTPAQLAQKLKDFLKIK
ncbi:response regulator [Patescibacteria group bacterium]|nr:response regulator [Patescibacteria group bacterium]